MDITTWRREYQIGDQKIDDQHRHLLDLANKLFESQFEEEIHQNIALLRAYMVEHCQAEEALMRDCKYPDYLEHKNDHDALLNDLDLFIKNTNLDSMENNKIKGFICSWLLDHVFGQDAKFGKFLHLSNQE